MKRQLRTALERRDGKYIAKFKGDATEISLKKFLVYLDEHGIDTADVLIEVGNTHGLPKPDRNGTEAERLEALANLQNAVRSFE